MGRKKNLLSDTTRVVDSSEDLIVSRAATIHCGASRRLEAHGKTKALTRKAAGIGRSRDNAIIIADGNVSKFHAIITFRKRGACIKDTGSTNGTTVNGTRLVRDKEQELNEGDVILLGTTKLTIRYGAAP